jgi:tRNA(fMet)-specific endonuclease VapC
MLDSNICIDVINSRPAIVLERFRLERLGDIVISSVTAAELALGVVKSGSARNRLALEMFLSTIAAHALTSNTILVTNNTREFERVPGLRLENWAI